MGAEASGTTQQAAFERDASSRCQERGRDGSKRKRLSGPGNRPERRIPLTLLGVVTVSSQEGILDDRNIHVSAEGSSFGANTQQCSCDRLMEYVHRNKPLNILRSNLRYYGLKSDEDVGTAVVLLPSLRAHARGVLLPPPRPGPMYRCCFWRKAPQAAVCGLRSGRW